MILDGKVIACDWCKEPAVSVRGEAIELWYSGKAQAQGGNVQAVLAPSGLPLWISGVEPGSVHDITGGVPTGGDSISMPVLVTPSISAFVQPCEARAVGFEHVRFCRCPIVVGR